MLCVTVRENLCIAVLFLGVKACGKTNIIHIGNAC